ncbi:MAG: hypothetical protein Q8930_05000 [Bacillota bacterium]|nr:hypothetical protein [Bacillota bacterium]
MKINRNADVEAQNINSKRAPGNNEFQNIHQMNTKFKIAARVIDRLDNSRK